MTNSWDTEAYNRLKKVTPNGCQTLSKMPERFVQGVYPKVLDCGQDGHVMDIAGNDYIDLISGLGAISLGYADHDVNQAVCEQIEKGTSFSMPTLVEAEVAETLCVLVPWTEMWKFGKTGTDGTVMSVRAARAATGRNKILTVGYNGCADVFECRGVRTAGIPENLKEHTFKAQYNKKESFAPLLSKEFACVLMEPMIYEYPEKGFLEYVRELCTETGTLLIFDEVVMGGRTKNFTASSYFKVIPDFIVLGKALANGFPLCAVGGKRSLMEVFERDDFFASGTFGGECVSLAACLITIQKLASKITSTIIKGLEIQQTFNRLFEGKAVCSGYPTRLIFKFPTPEHQALFMQEMCLNGVLVGSANFVMANHSNDDINQIKVAMTAAYITLSTFWDDPKKALKGIPPIPALRN